MPQMLKKLQQIKLMSKPGLALIAITAISVAVVAVQALSSSYYFIQSADAQARLPNNSVRSENIVDGEVKTQDLADDAVTSEKIKNGEVKAEDLDPSIEIGGGGAVELDIVRRSSSIQIPPGEFREITVSCMEGEILTGGGFAANPGVQILASAPINISPSPGVNTNVWEAIGENTSSSSKILAVDALCAKLTS